MLSRGGRYFLIGVFVVSAGLGYLSRLLSTEVVTNEVLAASLGKSHNIMRRQNQNILDLMDAFLRGESVLIAKLTGEIADDMSEVTKKFPPFEGEEAVQWRLMAQIVESAKVMRDSTLKRDYQTAYQNFTAVMAGCVACHQLRRSWGILPEPVIPEPATPKPETPAPSEQEPEKSAPAE